MLRRMRASRAWLAWLLLLPVTGCQQEDGAPTPVPPRSASVAPGTDESLRDAALALMAERERALREGDREAFLATVDPDALTFSATQARWFDNLARLPVSDVSYELGDEEAALAQVSAAGDLQLPVDFTMRLRGFDRRAVTERMVWTFVRDGDAALLADDRDTQFDAQTGWVPAPWDLVHIEVRRAGGILAVFDEDTVDNADYVMSDLAAATKVVGRHLPAWSRRFVAYGTSDVTAIERMSALTVDDTAGMAFPILARPGGPVAAYRFLVNPDVVGDVLSRGHVFRHELAHVALGGVDGGSPVWLAEGAAEYVASSTLPAELRRRLAVQRLAGATGRELESDQRFYTGDPTASYALAGLVCDYLATTRGERALWDLVLAFGSARTGSADVLRRELGLSTKELSAQALAWARSA
jgi:hypothetical protein